MDNPTLLPVGPPVVTITTIPISLILTRLIKRSYSTLTEILESAPQENDITRKENLLTWATKTRAQWVQMFVLLSWSRKKSTRTQADQINFSSGQIATFRVNLFAHDSFLNKASDLFCFNYNITRCRTSPPFDVATAVDVFTTGEYLRLPSSIRNGHSIPEVPSMSLSHVYKRLHDLIQLRLFTTDIPEPYSNIKIENGRAYCEVQNEFSVELTLVREDTPDWRLLAINLFVKPLSESESIVTTEVSRVLQNLVQHHVFSSEAPLLTIYKILHEFVLSTAFLIASKQVTEIAAAHKHLFDIKNSISGDANDFIEIRYWKDHMHNKDVNHPYHIKIHYITEDIGHVYLGMSHHCTNESMKHPTVPLSLSAISIETLLLRFLTFQADATLKAFSKSIKKRAEKHLPIEAEEIQMNSHSFRGIHSSSIRVTLFRKDFVDIGMEPYTGYFTLRRSRDVKAGKMVKAEEDLRHDVSKVGAILVDLKRNAIEYYIKEYFNSLDLQCFSSLQLTFSRVTFHFLFSSTVFFFRLKGWTSVSDRYISTFLAFEIRHTLSLNIFCICASRSSKHLAMPLQVENLFTIAKDLRIMEVNRSTMPLDHVKDERKFPESLFSFSPVPLHTLLENVYKKCSLLLGLVSFLKANGQYTPKIDHAENKVSFTVSSSSIQKVELHFSEDDDRWEVSFITNKLPEFPHNEGDKVKILRDKGLFLSYFKSATNKHFMQPWGHIFRTVRIADLKDKWEKILQTRSETSDFIRSHFCVSSYDYSHISFSCSVPEFGEQTLTMEYKRFDALVGLKPDYLAPFLRAKYLLDMSLSGLLMIVYRSCRPLRIIQRFFTISVRSCIYDFTIIPLSAECVRVVYRKKFGIDIRFTMNESVRINDAARSIFDESSQTHLRPLHGLKRLVPQSGTIPVSHIIVLHSALENTLASIHRMMGSQFLFSEMSERSAKSNPTGQNGLDNFSIPFKSAAFPTAGTKISLVDAERVEFQFDNSSERVELQIFQRFLAVITGPPYNLSQFFSCLHIVFTLPLDPFRAMISLLHAHLAGPNQNETYVTLSTDSGSQIFSHNQKENLALFTIRCYRDGDMIEFPLRYSYKRNNQLIQYRIQSKDKANKGISAKENLLQGMIKWMQISNAHDLRTHRNDLTLRCGV